MDKKPRRYYSNADIAGLMTLARGGCYAPDCNVPTIRMINGVPVLNLEIAHIRALEPGGKRFDRSWTVEQRNSFVNLILLCTAHHKVVDGRSSDQYSVEVLEQWKHAREADGLDALAGLNHLTEEKLATMIALAQGELLDRVGPALEEFSKTAPELATLLRTLTDELADPRVHGFGISEDGIEMLYESARVFSGLEDHAMTLSTAADKMGSLEEGAAGLKEAAESIEAAAHALTVAVDEARRYG